MCSTVACEMLVSHSPPVFSHSPPLGFLSQYTPFCLKSDQLPRTCHSVTSPFLSYRPFMKMPTSPRRPCLVIKPKQATDEEASTNPSTLKKKVVFADDKGMSLTQVRIMKEPSNMPPLWSYQFLAEVTQGLSAEAELKDDSWIITFSQPASDYIDFRKKLETKKVSLENVIVKENEDIITGTVKVLNLSYEKEVIIRASYDSWGTFEDFYCYFVPDASKLAANVVRAFDTFTFNISLNHRARRIEFCICFRCNGREYWDNNDNKNYVLVKKTQAANVKNEILVRTSTPKYSEAVQAKMDSWSEFASWNHLENSAPYW